MDNSPRPAAPGVPNQSRPSAARIRPQTIADRRPSASVGNYRSDRFYPRVCRAVEAILQRGKVVAPVEVLLGMGLLTAQNLENWRRGRVPYLERVIDCNLPRLSRLLRILRFHAHALNLVPSWTAYMRWGKGPKQRLRFTKTGDPRLEKAYATHLVWPGKGPFHPPWSKNPGRECSRDAVDAAQAAQDPSATAPDSRSGLTAPHGFPALGGG